MNKRIYWLVIAGLTLICLVDLVFPDHHHAVFIWHRLPAFDALYGFVGCILLILVAVVLGNCLLWRAAYSVPLPDDAFNDGATFGEIQNWLVAEGETVEENQPLVEILTHSSTVTVSSPKPGKITKQFYDRSDVVKVGETLVNIAVPKAALEHSADAGEASDA